MTNILARKPSSNRIGNNILLKYLPIMKSLGEKMAKFIPGVGIIIYLE